MRLRNESDSAPYQNDYLFASEGLLPALTAWEVQPTGQMWAASDHCPVVVTLDMDRTAVPA
jgi:exonuclease III